MPKHDSWRPQTACKHTWIMVRPPLPPATFNDTKILCFLFIFFHWLSYEILENCHVKTQGTFMFPWIQDGEKHIIVKLIEGHNQHVSIRNSTWHLEPLTGIFGEKGTFQHSWLHAKNALLNVRHLITKS